MVRRKKSKLSQRPKALLTPQQFITGATVLGAANAALGLLLNPETNPWTLGHEGGDLYRSLIFYLGLMAILAIAARQTACIILTSVRLERIVMAVTALACVPKASEAGLPASVNVWFAFSTMAILVLINIGRREGRRNAGISCDCAIRGKPFWEDRDRPTNTIAKQPAESKKNAGRS